MPQPPSGYRLNKHKQEKKQPTHLWFFPFLFFSSFQLLFFFILHVCDCNTEKDSHHENVTSRFVLLHKSENDSVEKNLLVS